MRINVLKELRQPLGSVSVFDIDEPLLSADGLLLESIKGAVTMLRTDRGLLVTVEAAGITRDECARCLKEISCDLEINFQEEYVPLADPNTGARIHLAPDDEVFRIGPDFDLDLTEGLRQYILISEPAKPLCAAACAGLCPRCGADLNQGPCGCLPGADERWSALAGLKKESREGS
jgi:uncharacterized protein